MAAVCTSCLAAQAIGPLSLERASWSLRHRHQGALEQSKSFLAPRRRLSLIAVAANPQDGGEVDDAWRTKTLTELEADFLGDKKPKPLKKPVTERTPPPAKSTEFRSVLDEMEELVFGKPKKESDATGIMGALNKTSKWLVDNTDVAPDDNVVLVVTSTILFVWLFFLGVATGVLHVPFVEQLLGM